MNDGFTLLNKEIFLITLTTGLYLVNHVEVHIVSDAEVTVQWFSENTMQETIYDFKVYFVKRKHIRFWFQGDSVH